MDVLNELIIDFMKKFLIKNIAVLALMSLVAIACQKDPEKDSIAPGQVSDVQIVPTHGGALITYKNPNDMDLLFVKATYTNTLGQQLFKVCSYYDSKIEIEGYNDTIQHQVQLVAVDRSQNESAPVVVTIEPQKSHIEVVKENMVLSPDFGGIRLVWENPESKTVYVHFSYTNTEGNQVVRYLSSSREFEKIVVRDMDTTRKEFFVQVEDFYGNKTDKVSKGSYSPLFEQKIPKSTWSLIANLSADGNAWEGKTINMWDDIIDTKESTADNSYGMFSRARNGGQLKYPLNVVIDLNATVIVDRFVVWQRAFWYGQDTKYFYYQSENIKSFSLYTSTDKLTWTPVGDFSITDPKDANGNISADAIADAIDGHEFILDEFTTPFRYLKFAITGNFGSEEYVNVSELTLFGSIQK